MYIYIHTYPVAEQGQYLGQLLALLGQFCDLAAHTHCVRLLG